MRELTQKMKKLSVCGRDVLHVRGVCSLLLLFSADAVKNAQYAAYNFPCLLNAEVILSRFSKWVLLFSSSSFRFCTLWHVIFVHIFSVLHLYSPIIFVVGRNIFNAGKVDFFCKTLTKQMVKYWLQHSEWKRALKPVLLKRRLFSVWNKISFFISIKGINQKFEQGWNKIWTKKFQDNCLLNSKRSFKWRLCYTSKVVCVCVKCCFQSAQLFFL